MSVTRSWKLWQYAEYLKKLHVTVSGKELTQVQSFCYQDQYLLVQYSKTAVNEKSAPVIVVTDPHRPLARPPQTGAITIHCAAA